MVSDETLRKLSNLLWNNPEDKINTSNSCVKSNEGSSLKDMHERDQISAEDNNASESYENKYRYCSTAEINGNCRRDDSNICYKIKEEEKSEEPDHGSDVGQNYQVDVEVLYHGKSDA